MALIACQGPAGPAGADGVKGDPGTPGAPGEPGAPGADAPRNMPPMLKDGMSIGTQYLALNAREVDGMLITENAIDIFHKFETLEVSKYFEDPEGVANLIFSLVDLSEDEKEIITVSLSGTQAMDTLNDEGTATAGGDGDIDDETTDTTPVPEMPAHMESVTGPTWLSISGKKAGSVTLTLMVKDGLPGGTSSQTITVMIRNDNAPPEVVSTVLNSAAFTTMSRTGTMRIRSDMDTVVEIPTGAFIDPNGDMLTLSAELGGTDAAAVAANAARLGVKIVDGNLVLTPKTNAATTHIPVVLKAMDRYGAMVRTGGVGADAEAVTSDPRTMILVRINNPPMNVEYTAGTIASAPTVVTVPAGAKAGDPIKLAHLSDKVFSVASNADATDFITLATFFSDLDTTEDPISGGATANPARICAFDTSPADQEFAKVAFNTGGTAITVDAEMRGTFDLSVTCTDNLGETVTDSVEVTIIQ